MDDLKELKEQLISVIIFIIFIGNPIMSLLSLPLWGNLVGGCVIGYLWAKYWDHIKVYWDKVKAFVSSCWTKIKEIASGI